MCTSNWATDGTRERPVSGSEPSARVTQFALRSNKPPARPCRRWFALTENHPCGGFPDRGPERHQCVAAAITLTRSLS
ncbi:hypothetical protein BZL30_9385 [Mycobacterium kansasii]|uniref:Uncharacterized protein n=1 Tax=Mycobacterium kansasii TaxID=1768 RepID=A0A1V3W9V2_MYCKA|nr:hypothetical protein BZL30_9385 [Mycobacterium kansasii]